MFRYVLIFNILMTCCYAASELYSENEEIKSALNQNMYEPNYLSLFLGLFLVIGLIYFTGFIYQKLTKVKINNYDETLNKAEIISTTPLGQGKNLHVIKVNDEFMLIASVQNNVVFLKELNCVGDREEIGKDYENG